MHTIHYRHHTRNHLAIIRMALGIVFSILGIALVNAEKNASIFEQANNLYAQGKFTEAIQSYETLLKSGSISAALYYNLGNAYYKAGQNGMAIASYSSALRLNPRDADIKANLNFVRNKCNVSSPTKIQRWKEWLSIFSLNEWAGAAIVLSWWVFGGWSYCLWRGIQHERFKRILKIGSGILAIVVVLFSLRLIVFFGDVSAVVVAKEAAVKYGPLEESKVFYQISEGSEITVLDSKAPWIQIKDAAARIGWIKENQIKVIH